jgi:hypothetical protein
MASRKKHKKAKAPSATIVKDEDEEAFLIKVNEYFDKGYRPIQEMAMFAELEQKTGKWRTIYILPLVHFEEFKEFQSIPMSEAAEEERMFG